MHVYEPQAVPVDRFGYARTVRSTNSTVPISKTLGHICRNRHEIARGWRLREARLRPALVRAGGPPSRTQNIHSIRVLHLVASYSRFQAN